MIVKTSLSRSGFLATIDYLQSTLSVVSALNVASLYAKAIQEIMKHPTRAVKDIDLLSTRDLEQLRIWNQDFPQKVDSCVHELVLRHAERSPQSPALCSWDGDLTFFRAREAFIRFGQKAHQCWHWPGGLSALRNPFTLSYQWSRN